MDDAGDDARYPSPYGANRQQGYGSSDRQKIPDRGGLYLRPAGNQYGEEDEEDDNEEDDEMAEEEEENDNARSNGFQFSRKDAVDVNDDDNDDEEDDDDDNDDEDTADDDEENEDHGKRVDYAGRNDDIDLARHPKKRKLKSLVSSYEFAPRVPTPTPVALKPSSSTARQSFGGRNSLTDWTERETLVLLDSWGDRFLQRGKKSLRSEEWQEVAEKVSEVSKVERTDTQCRNRLDTLKKKYKKEKLSSDSKWVYFKKLDLLLSSSSPPQQSGLSCGLDSGEYIFMNPRVYLNRANGLDEMRDSPENSESGEKGGDDDDDSDGLPPKKRKLGKNKEKEERSSMRLLADAINTFSNIYEKLEVSRSRQMVEIEKMRMDFLRDFEVQKRQIMEKAEAEIAKIRRGDEDDSENASG